MKKIGIASCYFKHNYGSMLQAYATQWALDRLKLRNETLDISGILGEISHGKRKYYLRNLFNVEMYNAKKGFIRHMVQRKLDQRFAERISQRDAAFEQFKRQYFRMAIPAHSKKELRDYCLDYNAVLAGSDQLWLPLNIEGDYYTLNFVPDTVRRVAYATSFGVSELPAWQEQKAQRFLNRIHAISVREQSGKDLIQKLCNRDVPVVCDPTLLFTGEEWTGVQGLKNVAREKYIFCYFLGNSRLHRDFAQRLKAATGYQIVTLRHLDEFIPSDEDFGDEAPYDIGPDKFMDLIRNAEYICTDSFHGSVFSLLNHKQFFVFRRFQKAGSQSTNTRIDSLLCLAGIPERLIEGYEDASACLQMKINYEQVDRKVGSMREASLSFLKTALLEA